MAVIARHLTIHGRVQGVFYRDWTVKTARELGLAGWVRNCRDGSVEALIQGEQAAVERFASLAEEGPPAAEVERVESNPADRIEATEFQKRATA